MVKGIGRRKGMEAPTDSVFFRISRAATRDFDCRWEKGSTGLPGPPLSAND
jgi:hypothetical protein